MTKRNEIDRPAIRPSPDPPGRQGERSHLVRLVGPLDAFSCRGVEEELARLVFEHPRLTVDLCDVEVLTSGGLAMLERCRTISLRVGHSLRLRVRQDSIVQRVVQMGAPDLLAATEGWLRPVRRESEGA